MKITMCSYSKAFIEYSNDIDNIKILKNNFQKILTIFDEIIADVQHEQKTIFTAYKCINYWIYHFELTIYTTEFINHSRDA